MHEKTVITCAVTGNITTPEQHPGLPVTPEQIATACLDAADAGASVVHIHVRDPATGKPSMDLAHYRTVIELIRARNTDLVLNLTTGPGGRFVPDAKDPRQAGPGTTLVAPEVRVEHIAALKPDICTLDLNTMNSGDQVVINTPANVTRMARIINDAGVKPEIELFDTGDIGLMNALIRSGVLHGPPLCSLVLGVKYALPATADGLLFASRQLPPGAIWTGFGVGRMALPMVAQSYIAGGHVRIGLEDTIFIKKGVLAHDNAQLVNAAREIIELMGGQIATPGEARSLMGLE